MADPVTANIGLSDPIRGSDVGTWDVPVSGDFTILDACAGGITQAGIGSTTVTLAASQAQVNILRFTGTLTAAAQIVLPQIYKSWTVENLTTGSFALTIGTTAAGQIIGLPQGGDVECYSDGTNLKFRNIGRVGTYWDFSGSSVPAWVSACTVAPWLNCDGTAFSSAAYPYLATLLGGTTLPDLRGVTRATLNQGTSRITSSQSGVNGNAILSNGGSQTVTIGTSNQAPYTPSGTVLVGGGAQFAGTNPAATVVNNGASNIVPLGSALITATYTGSPQGGVSAPLGSMNPVTIGGITMIRAA